MVRRIDDGSWAFPGGKLKDGETAEQAARREFFEECNYRVGGLKFLMRRVKDDQTGDGVVDFSTFIAEVPDEFAPRLNHEASAYAWLDPEETLAENRPEAIADGAEGQDGPEVPQPLYPVADFPAADEDRDLEEDVDDISDEDADLILSGISHLEARLERLEGVRDDATLFKGRQRPTRR